MGRAISAMMGRALLAWGMFIGTSSALAGGTWGLNDVSILFPIQDPAALTELLSPLSAGARGELLPRKVFDTVPKLLPLNPEDTWGRMHVVAARIDPCFPGDASAHAPCRKQLRLVWQPLHFQSDSGTVFTFDAAVHTFYSLGDTEFATLASEFRQLRNTSSASDASLPLQIHPVLKREGLRGRFHAALKRTLLKFAGDRNLTRVTFMTNSVSGFVWVFGGLDRVAGTFKPISIPRIQAPLQRFINQAFRARDYYTHGIFPEPPEPDSLGLLVKPSQEISANRQGGEILAAARSAVRMENPGRFTPENLDCASCHAAQAARVFAMRKFPTLQLGRAMEADTYISQLSVVNTTPQPEITTNLRAFGYFETLPAISQRVIHESAEVVRELTRLGL